MRSSSNYKNLFKRLNKRLKAGKLKYARLRKAQFFILTGLVIISIFYLLSKWISPYTVIDTSEVALSYETFVFNNVKQHVLKIVEDSESCEEAEKNLDEYEKYIEDYLFERLLLYFDFNYSLATPCNGHVPGTPLTVNFDMELRGRKIRISYNSGVVRLIRCIAEILLRLP